jgi:hypothetical protein
LKYKKLDQLCKLLIFNVLIFKFKNMGLVLVVYLLIVILMIASMWKVYEKAGKPGWAAIVPIYNIIVLLEIVKKPVWWIVLLIIPIVNIIVALIIYMQLAKSFGKSSGFGLGLVFLGFIFFPILAFGDAQYESASNDSLLDA